MQYKELEIRQKLYLISNNSYFRAFCKEITIILYTFCTKNTKNVQGRCFMYRKFEEELKIWKENYQMPLMLVGARQTGKTSKIE